MIATMSRPATAAGPAGHPPVPALLSRPYPAVMGVLNVTPDSFSDGGQFTAPELALAQARRMVAEGADIIDIGAESTRPYGSEPISADEELKRLQPVLADVVSLGVPVSIDSMKSAVVAWALDNGAAIANDVWGLQRDGAMTALARLNELSIFGLPLLVGASRKRFISTVTPSEPQQRLGGSIAAHLIAAQGGARIIRTHDVAETVQALQVAAAIREQQ